MTAQPTGFAFPITLYRSEIIKDTVEPHWAPFTLNVDDVRGLDTEFTISTYDWDKDGCKLIFFEKNLENSQKF